MTVPSTNDVIVALERHGGIRLLAARMLGLSRSELNRIIDTDERLKAALKDIGDRELERLDRQLADMAKAGNATALKFLARVKTDQTPNNEAINGSRKA